MNYAHFKTAPPGYLEESFSIIFSTPIQLKKIQFRRNLQEDYLIIIWQATFL